MSCFITVTSCLLNGTFDLGQTALLLCFILIADAICKCNKHGLGTTFPDFGCISSVKY
jgi:tetrahydromethanopterin S-methyltransferase subunit C